MNLAEIKKLIEIFNSNTDITRLSLRQDNFELKLSKGNNEVFATSQPITPLTIQPQMQQQQIATQPQIQASPSSSNEASNATGDYITSPMVGTFYHKPSPDAAPYVNVGDMVKKGQTIGIIEAMKIMNEIEAEYDCKILAIESADGQPVEYGTKLIKVEKL